MEKTIKEKFIAEPELIRKLQGRSREALEYLYDNYSGAVFGLILKIVNNKQLAEEILQDTFMRVWTRIADYDSSKGRLFTWIINIARNLAIDKIRSAEVSRSSKTYDSTRLVSVEDKNKGAEAVDSIGIDTVLAQLPEDQNKLIKMMYYQGYTQSEISEELNMPVGTVKTRVRAGMLMLRQLLR